MRVGRSLDVRNGLQTLFLMLSNLSLMGHFKFAEHLVEGNGEAPDFVVALVVDTIAVILVLSNLPRHSFDPRQGLHDVAIGDKGKEEAQRGERARQPKAAIEPREEIVDALVDETLQLGLTYRPRRDRLIDRRIVKAIARLGRSRIGYALIHGIEIRRDASQHLADVAFDGLPQLLIGISAIG